MITARLHFHHALHGLLHGQQGEVIFGLAVLILAALLIGGALSKG